MLTKRFTFVECVEAICGFEKFAIAFLFSRVCLHPSFIFKFLERLKMSLRPTRSNLGHLTVKAKTICSDPKYKNYLKLQSWKFKFEFEVFVGLTSHDDQKEMVTMIKNFSWVQQNISIIGKAITPQCFSPRRCCGHLTPPKTHRTKAHCYNLSFHNWTCPIDTYTSLVLFSTCKNQHRHCSLQATGGDWIKKLSALFSYFE